MKISLMKTALLSTMIVLWGSAAFGQASTGVSALSGQPQPLVFESHPAHASRTPMASDQDQNGGAIIIYEQGERPLWEVATPKQEISLGEAARALREEHSSVKKAVRSWQNY